MKVTASPLDLAGGTDARREHEVELLRLGDLVARLRVGDLELADELAKLLATEVIDLKEECAVSPDRRKRGRLRRASRFMS